MTTPADRPLHERLTSPLPTSVQRIGLGVVLLLGVLDAWRYARYQVNPDGVSYVDLALAFASDGPVALVNGYWSPLYPAVIGLAYWLWPPTLESLYLIAHAVTFPAYVLAALAFHRLLTVLRERSAVLAAADDLANSAIVVVAWSAFALFIYKGVPLSLVTPDTGVAAIVFWLVAELLALGGAPWPGRRWIIAGTVLGIGYWWKAILFPTGVVWLAAAAHVAWRRGDPRRGIVAGAVTYVVLAAILAIPVSLQTGRVTFGETGRLNYLWYANVAPYVWERCLPRDIGETAAAPFGRIARDSLIADEPTTCAISSPLATATMPLWDDPSRYYRDAHPRLDRPRQVQAIRNNVEFLRKEIVLLGPMFFLASGAALLLAGALAARRLAGPATAGPARSRTTWIATGAFLAAPVAFYLVVYVEFRHVAPFVAAACVLAAVALLAAWPRRGRYAVALLAALALGDVAWRQSTQTLIGFTLARSTLLGRAPERVPTTHIVARALRDAGLEPGTHVVSIYDAWNAEWAQLAGLRIRAHVPEWTTPIDRVLRSLRDDCVRARWDDALRRHGIAAAVARVPEGMPAPATFERLEDTEFHLYRIPAAGPMPAGCAVVPTRSSS